MREVLKTYKDRLINLNGRNRSLVLRKIYKKRSFDMFRLLREECLKEDGLFEYILSRKKTAFQIMDDPFKMRVQRIKALEKQIESDKDEEVQVLRDTVEEMYPLSEEEMQVMIKREAEIDEKYALLIEDEKKIVERQIEKIIGYSNQINYLAREIDAVEKETGKYELFIGYPFVEGRFNDGTFVRGPLALFPVELVKKNNQWSIKNIADQDVLINKVLVYAYAKYNNIKLEDFDTEFSSLDSFGDNIIEGMITYINEHKLVTNTPMDLSMIKFVDYTNDTIPSYQSGELVVKPYTVVGQFPLSNSIYTDYQMLERADVDHDLLEALLLNKEDLSELKMMEKEEEIKEAFLSEHDTNFFTQLDYSQENAIGRLNDSNKLVIYGPPGTGKSHTIANMISDAMCKNKRVLMVSQKRAALDVIYNRLSDLKGKMVLIHDANKDKKAFYQKVAEAVKEESLLYDLNAKLQRDELASRIDEKVIGLETIARILMEERPFGLSLQEMYIKTKGIFEIEDERFALYKQFRKNNPFVEYKYQELKKAIDRLSSDEMLINLFSKYRKMIDDNPYMAAFAHKMDIMSYEDVVDGTKAIQQIIDEQKDTDKAAYSAFATYYYEHQDDVSNDGLREAAIAYNHTLNQHLIDEEEHAWWQVGESIKRLAHMKEINANKKLYSDEQTRYIELFRGYKDMVQMALSAMDGFKSDLTEYHYDFLKRRLIQVYFIGTDLNQLINALDAQTAFLPLKTRIQTLLPLEMKVMDYVYDMTEDQDSMKLLLVCLMEYIILEQINQIEKSEDFNEFYLYFNMYTENVDDITKLMVEKNDLTKEIAKSHWNDQFQVFVDTATFKEFKRQAEKKSRLWPIRKYIIEFSELLLTLFPCWLLSPETVSDIFPLVNGLFDLVIFDEASQIFVENAIPTIYRGNAVVIAGDDKQLQPTSTFNTKYDEFDEEETTLETVAAYEEESLLDLAKVNYDSVHLNYHYRSRYEELINFSNYAFYDGGLNISPNIKHTKALKHPPIERIMVDGLWEGRKNKEEASRVVDLVAEILATRKKEETIGIITFNITQKDLIEDLLEARMNFDKDFKDRYLKERSRFDGNEDVSIFVKNIENVQGDERDIIIFSVGYAKGTDGKVRVNFGSLSQDGGENRLNVAISRAKRKVYVVQSIEPEMLKVEGTLNQGPKLFRNYLEYVRSVSERDEDNATITLKQFSETKTIIGKDNDEFVDAVAEALTGRGHEVMKNIGSSESKIDLALLHPDTKEFVLGIECDGKTYRSIPSVRERDIHRKRFLESRGWEMTRIWSIDWWKEPSQVIDKIEHFLKVLLDAQEVIEEPSELTMKPLETLEADEVYPEGTVWFGDTVLIKDNMTKEVFDINMINNPRNKDLMNGFMKFLLGKNNGDVFVYEGFEYQVVGIDKK